MSLLELLTGATVFALGAGASLQLWALSGSAAVSGERQRLLQEQAEATLLRAEQSLRGLAPGGGDCSTAAGQLRQALAAEPLAAGLTLQIEPTAGGEALLLRLGVEGEAEPRQRLLAPAALGRCTAPSPGPAPGGAGGTV